MTLLIHAKKLMKIIQMLKIIKKTLLKIGANDENIEQIIEDATKIGKIQIKF